MIIQRLNDYSKVLQKKDSTENLENLVLQNSLPRFTLLLVKNGIQNQKGF